MGLGTKNRQKQTADFCKQHLREKYRDQRGLVEEFILEFEGARKNCDLTRWDRFTDIKGIKKEMLKRLPRGAFREVAQSVSSMKREPTAEEREKIGSAIGSCKAGGGEGGVGKRSRHRRVTTLTFALLR
jgi:hypothetical protein